MERQLLNSYVQYEWHASLHKHISAADSAYHMADWVLSDFVAISRFGDYNHERNRLFANKNLRYKDAD